MPSPFPGMNPYLEQADVWPDFHHSFITYIRDALAVQISPHYFLRIEEQVYLHELPSEERVFLGRPDVSVFPSQTGSLTTTVTQKIVAPASAMVPPPFDELRIPYLEIRDRNSRIPVTIIELLSPSNKYAGPDREMYWGKIRRVSRTATHLVELDLLRGGPRMPWINLQPCAYYALVSRASLRPNVDCWPIQLRDPLPTIPIPLRDGEPEPTLDLQAILHRVYDAAGYEYSIYTGTPEPMLTDDDATWASTLLPAGSIAPRAT